MGIVYAAELRPSKMELVAQWLPGQEWFYGDAGELVRLGSFRFDDLAGEVGIETHIVGAGDKVYQVPLTYRGAPLAGAEAFLVGTMEHSVLGSRWVYDATADPVYQAELAAALLTGKPQAVEHKDVAGTFEALPHTAVLFSTGTPDAGLPELRFGLPSTTAGVTSIPAGDVNFAVLRELDTTGTFHHETTLAVTWDGQAVPVLVAAA
ncbi:hypothetical protein ART_3772 [Arthrobacter sp. PAMC 25486]|uniref:CG0192-related protein n=1 Tax=Arthrobacter sp. PAMC 25486 TaxID=1494608 RepID=UPI00053607D4|nr:hypothetical protein [Arthrobacter sp. PAMC 25486]AIY03371.1 hypothetical protein ART_3772 [Arthrobacter sp. PAMC 25486]